MNKSREHIKGLQAAMEGNWERAEWLTISAGEVRIYLRPKTPGAKRGWVIVGRFPAFKKSRRKPRGK